MRGMEQPNSKLPSNTRGRPGPPNSRCKVQSAARAPSHFGARASPWQDTQLDCEHARCLSERRSRSYHLPLKAAAPSLQA